ncbi:MAG: cytochrome-c peroxidase [Acidobacteria bacterium]|nr:cytochrome-c peroxidase [Candidatus Sulfomarinibacter kjeldsenii]
MVSKSTTTACNYAESANHAKNARRRRNRNEENSIRCAPWRRPSGRGGSPQRRRSGAIDAAGSAAGADPGEQSTTTQFWDGRSPDLEDQALHPFINPVEHGLKNHDPILKIVRKDPEYKKAFQEVFGKKGKEITMREVTLAIAAFERTVISGDSPFDRYYFGGEEDDLTEQQKRGFDLFLNEGRCVSCHVIEQTQALFTDNRFHNIGVGINNIQNDVPKLAGNFLQADMTVSEVDVEVLTDARTSELGRFAISHGFDDLGSFKTPTLRNIAVTSPYMHDGSIETLKDVVIHYNNGGVTDVGDPVNDFLSGGIRALDLDEDQIDDLVAFMEALTSPEFEPSADEADGQ